MWNGQEAALSVKFQIRDWISERDKWAGGPILQSLLHLWGSLFNNECMHYFHSKPRLIFKINSVRGEHADKNSTKDFTQDKQQAAM